MTPARARCACGDLRLEVTGAPLLRAVCHCDNCKQRTGSAFGISFYFREQDVEITGKATEYALYNAAQDHDQHRYFCPRCGTTLYWRVSVLAGQIGVAGGCFTDGMPGAPTLSATDAKRYEWVELPAHWECR